MLYGIDIHKRRKIQILLYVEIYRKRNVHKVLDNII